MKVQRIFAEKAYTLIEALVASSILLIGIGAAASLSLTLLTQEEISERATKALNYLDTAAMLAQLGVPDDSAILLIPEEPILDSVSYSPFSHSYGAGPKVFWGTQITVTFHSTNAKENPSSEINWTGGEMDKTRTESVSVLYPASVDSIN